MSFRLISIFLLGTCFHIWSMWLNDILKIADSFAYLQMGYFLQSFSQEWLGNGWFGFLYSLPIALINIFVGNDFFSAKIVNIILLNISAVLLYKITLKFLSKSWSYFVLILFFISPTLLHFNIHILSENIYIPLFLFLILKTLSYAKKPNTQDTILLAVIVACMYLTRAEAFIYILSIFWFSLYLLKNQRFSLKDFCKYGGVFLFAFFICISPYIYHLHTLTGERGLTNKWASNLRQAELRGTKKLDDAGFERAVAELTPDKRHLIAGFAGGMKYDTPRIEWSLVSFIKDNPSGFIERFLVNQQKLYSKNLPEIFLWKSPKLYLSDDSRFGSNILFLIFSLFPLLILLYGIIHIYKNQRDFFSLCLSFFIPASVFFTLFFTLNRYFLIFLPLLLIAFVYGVQELQKQKNIMWSTTLSFILVGNILWVLLLSNSVYINTEKNKDTYYTLKKEAGTWLRENHDGSLADINILERFPIVTYYSGSKNRWITPYEAETKHIVEYAKYNDIQYLVVDTMDFLTYRPFLSRYLSETTLGMKKIKEFNNSDNQKVILYEFLK